jgi:hypothetical protein
MRSHYEMKRDITRDLQHDPSISALMQKPMIIGASVSADRSATSPGKKLALRYTSMMNIFSHARGGRPGRETMKLVRETALDRHTIVLALDLFFWDSVETDVEASLHELDHLFTMVNEHRIPLILGNIPGIMPRYQPGRAVLNAAIEKKINAYAQGALMDFDLLYRKIRKEGSVMMNHRAYSLRELVPDGLHLSDIGSEYLTTLLLELVKTVAERSPPGRK